MMTKAEGSRAWYYANRDKANASARRWATAHKDEVKAIKKRYYDSNRDKVRAFARRYSRDNRLKRLDWRFKKQYGITFKQYSSMVIAQLGCCFICKQPC